MYIKFKSKANFITPVKSIIFLLGQAGAEQGK